MLLHRYVVVIVVVLISSCDRYVKADISDAQYSLMPELFFLDNYDQCMLKGQDALFCTFTFNLRPISTSNSSIWNIIAYISTNPQNYRHDQLRHGICVPTTCQKHYGNNKSQEAIIQACYNEKYENYNLQGNISDLFCQSNAPLYPVDEYDIALGIVMVLYLLFVVVASFYERLVLHKNKMTFYQKNVYKAALIISAFSVPKNWYRLTTVNSTPDTRKIRSFQGVKFYTIICVIMSHTIFGVLSGPVSNPQFTENSTRLVMNMFIANGWYVVQTFYVISGWLLSFHFLDMTSGTTNFTFVHIFWAIFNRYIRLAPTLAVMAIVHSTWLAHVSRGPYWDTFVGEERRNCRKNAWTNILFVNNHVNNDSMCLHQTWYIAADMQLFALSMIVLYIIYKFPAKTKFVFLSLLTMGFVLPGILAYVYEYDIIIRQYPEAVYKLNLLKLDTWQNLFSSGYSNIFGYTIGLVFGHLFFTYRNIPLKIRMVHKILWWFLTFGMCTSLVLLPIVFYDPDFEVTPWKSALHWSCGKNLFALGLAIGLFGFTRKIGWFARWICEFRPVQVLGRLTYSMYLVHTFFVRWQMGYKRYPASANDGMLFLAVLSDVASACLVGTLLCLLVEMPVSALQKVLGTSPTKKRTTVRKSSEKSLETLDMTNDNNTT